MGLKAREDLNLTVEINMQRKMKIVAYLMLSALMVLFLYILLHECGHLIVMLSAGATITDFSVLTAHVSAVGGNYSNLSDLWLHANGAFIPILVSLVYMMRYRKKNESLFYHIFSYLFSLIPIGSLFAWVVIPFVYLQGNAPVGDDVTYFLYTFSQNHHPLTVSAVSTMIIAIDVTVMIKKGIIQNLISIIKER